MSTTATLMKPKRPMRNALIGVGAAVALISGGMIAANAATPSEQKPASAVEAYTPEPQITDTYTPAMGVLIDQIEQQAIADAAAAQAAAEAAAAQAAADAAAQAAAQQAAQQAPQNSNTGSGASSGLPSGAAVPNRPDGTPDTSACASSSASFVGGVAVCD